MNRILIFLLTFCFSNAFGQVPNGMSFQAVIRDLDGTLISNRNISLKISVIEGSITGSEVYSELHSVTTNANGLLTLIIGEGDYKSGSLSDIDWISNSYYLKRQIDPQGGTNYTIEGISQFLSVPFSFASKIADSVRNTQTISLSNDTIYLSDGGFVKLPSGTVDTDQQNLSSSRSGSQVTISIDRGNSISFLDEVNDSDSDSTNEIQTISKVDRTVTLSNNGGSFVDSVLTEAQVDAYTSNNGYLTSEVDGSTTNEIQVLSIRNDTIYLSDGGFAKLPAGFDGDYSSLTNKPTIPTNTSELTNDSGFLTSEVDGSNTNELQELSVSTTGDTLYLSSGNYVIIPGISLNNPPVITEIDGNTYKTVWIGNQLWFAENLKTTHYNDGALIPNVTDSITWSGLSTGARSYYDNDSTQYDSVYGPLYNWYAVETGKLCPIGWHIPSDAEWYILTEFLGGDSYGGKLKELGTVHWSSPNTNASDEYGFTALPGGARSNLFVNIKNVGYWWSKTQDDIDRGFDRILTYNNDSISRGSAPKSLGFSVRCLKD